MKKLISMLMAGAMVLALSVPALAATQGTYAEPAAFGSASKVQENKLTVAAETSVPTIALTMPKMDKAKCIIVNPYQLKFTGQINGGSTINATDDKYYDAQIISPDFVIRNATNGNLTVTATVTSTLKGNMKLEQTDWVNATSTDSTPPTTNWAYITLKAAAIANDKVTINTTTKAATSVTWTGATVKTIPLKAGAVKLENSGSGDTAVNNAIDLPRADETAPNYLAFRFDGTANASPKTPWAATDSVSIDVLWTFTPADNGTAASGG